VAAGRGNGIFPRRPRLARVARGLGVWG